MKYYLVNASGWAEFHLLTCFSSSNVSGNIWYLYKKALEGGYSSVPLRVTCCDPSFNLDFTTQPTNDPSRTFYLTHAYLPLPALPSYSQIYHRLEWSTDYSPRLTRFGIMTVSHADLYGCIHQIWSFKSFDNSFMLLRQSQIKARLSLCITMLVNLVFSLFRELCLNYLCLGWAGFCPAPF